MPVVLFGGHMVDRSDRPKPRFPPRLESAAATAIAKALHELGVVEDDLALCSGAGGGDVLFAEEALLRGMRLELRLPFSIDEFVAASVAPAGEDWVDRFRDIAKLADVLTIPDTFGAAKADDDPFEKTNQWLTASASSYGGRDGFALLVLWDHRESDGRGGTAHLVSVAAGEAASVTVIDPHDLKESDVGTTR